MTEELLKTKPADPTPQVIAVLNRLAMENQIKQALRKQF
jgi:hypothetical protein